MVGDYSTDYEQLALSELEAAAAAPSEDGKSYHLNKAAVFAYLCDDQSQTFAKSLGKATIISTLRSLLSLSDSLGQVMASIHIDAALVALEAESVPLPLVP